jgi:hypothetical protein
MCVCLSPPQPPLRPCPTSRKRPISE